MDKPNTKQFPPKLQGSALSEYRAILYAEARSVYDLSGDKVDRFIENELELDRVGDLLMNRTDISPETYRLYNKLLATRAELTAGKAPKRSSLVEIIGRALAA